MSSRRLLSDEEIGTVLGAHPRWERDGDGLRCRFEFADFSEAFAFMTRVALVAERQFHHPEWSNVWNTVDIRITDHEAGGISENDRAFVEAIDRLG